MKLVNNLDLNKNEVQNARIQNLASAPANPVEGQIYYNSSDKKNYQWNGAAWVYFIPSSMSGSGNGLDADTIDGQHGSYYLNRANHSGTQLASTISDFDTQVRSSRLDQMALPTADVSLNSRKITNLATPLSSTDAATKGYVDSAVEGLDPKASVKAASTGNLTLANEQTVDNVSLTEGMRILVKNQDTLAENGIYIVKAAASWVRATDADTWGELVSAYVFVEEGTTNKDSGWVCIVNTGGTLGVTDISWTQFNGSGTTDASNVGTAGVGVFKQKSGSTLQFKKLNAGSNKISITDDTSNDEVDIDVNVSNLGVAAKYSVAVGNNADTSLTVTHNLGTRDVVVSIRETSTPYAIVIADIDCTDTNTVTVKFAVAPTTNQYTVTVMG